jgi:hypothetical protein
MTVPARVSYKTRGRGARHAQSGQAECSRQIAVGYSVEGDVPTLRKVDVWVVSVKEHQTGALVTNNDTDT